VGVGADTRIGWGQRPRPFAEPWILQQLGWGDRRLGFHWPLHHSPTRRLHGQLGGQWDHRLDHPDRANNRFRRCDHVRWGASRAVADHARRTSRIVRAGGSELRARQRIHDCSGLYPSRSGQHCFQLWGWEFQRRDGLHCDSRYRHSHNDSAAMDRNRPIRRFRRDCVWGRHCWHERRSR